MKNYLMVVTYEFAIYRPEKSIVDYSDEIEASHNRVNITPAATITADKRCFTVVSSLRTQILIRAAITTLLSLIADTRAIGACCMAQMTIQYADSDKNPPGTAYFQFL